MNGLAEEVTGLKGELQGAKASIVWWEHFSPFQSSVFHSLVETNLLEPTEFGTSSAQNIIALKTLAGQTQVQAHILHFPDMFSLGCQTHLRGDRAPQHGGDRGCWHLPRGVLLPPKFRASPAGRSEWEQSTTSEQLAPAFHCGS